MLEGSVITIWFHNQMPGPAGYQQGKEIALQEMNLLLSEIRANRLTIQQAAEKIKSNQNLAQVDSSWKGNATFDFAVGNGDKITYSAAIDKEILKLNEGQVSGIINGKDLDPITGKQIDAVFMIAQVTKRGTSQQISYDKWLTKYLKEYEVIRY